MNGKYNPETAADAALHNEADRAHALPPRFCVHVTPHHWNRTLFTNCYD